MSDRLNDPFSDEELQQASLLARFFDGDLSDAELAQWDRKLAENEETRDILVTVCLQRQLLQHILSDAKDGEQAVAPSATEAPSAPMAGIVFGLPGTPGDTGRGIAGYFWQEMPFAYLVATVVVGIGLWIGALVHVSPPVRVAEQSLTVTKRQQSPVPPMQFVGRITGMVDCRWETEGLGIRDWGLEDPRSKVHASKRTQSIIPNPQSLVSLGDRFALASGLMEITYNSGAKVIMQGPATFEVESAAGGFLAVGKLTARVEKSKSVRSTEYEVRSGEENDTPENQKSEIRNQELFAVRTPTAIVTDLGTEFGVEVGKSGATIAHVFSGVVEVQTEVADGRPQDRTIRLIENESVRVELGGVEISRGPLVVEREAAGAERFVRELPALQKPFSVKVLAHYRLGEDDHGHVPGKLAVEETANHVPAYSLQRHGSPSYISDTAAPGSLLGMSFIAANGDYFSGERMRFRPSDNFVVEAWARPNRVVHQHEIVVYIGNSAVNGYGLIVHNGEWEGMFGSHAYVASGVRCEKGKWVHLALVCERRHAQLWINGHSVGNGYHLEDGYSYAPDPLLTIGGNPLQVKDPLQVEYFDGQIDEVKLSEFRGPFRPEMLLFRPVDEHKANEK